MLIDVITLLQQKVEAGTPAERQLASAILEDVPEASRLTIAALAEKANVFRWAWKGPVI